MLKLNGREKTAEMKFMRRTARVHFIRP